MVSATAAVFSVLLAVVMGKEKKSGDKMAGFHDGLGAMSGVEAAFHCFWLIFVGVHSRGGGACVLRRGGGACALR